MANNATTYAQALVQTALGEWLEQLAAVQRAVRRSPELAVTLSDPNALPTDRESAVGRLLPASTAPEVRNFVRLLVTNGDLNKLEEVLRKVREFVPTLDESSNVEVLSAHELSAEEREKLEARLAADHGEGLRVRYEVEPALLGGLRIRVGDRVMDYSVAARLEALRERLIG